jgi:hypothetical protein
MSQSSELKGFKFTITAILLIFVACNLYIMHHRDVQQAELIGFIKGASKCVPLEELIEPEPSQPNPFSKA